jgi:hypothetical protein
MEYKKRVAVVLIADTELSWVRIAELVEPVVFTSDDAAIAFLSAVGVNSATVCSTEEAVNDINNEETSVDLNYFILIKTDYEKD